MSDGAECTRAACLQSCARPCVWHLQRSCPGVSPGTARVMGEGEAPQGLIPAPHRPTHTHTHTQTWWHTLTNKNCVGLNTNSSWQSSSSQAWKYAELLLSSGSFLNLDLSPVFFFLVMMLVKTFGPVFRNGLFFSDHHNCNQFNHSCKQASQRLFIF